MKGQPALFDLADFEREAVAATPWHGAPLTYTTDYYDPSDLLAAFQRYRDEFGDFGCIPRSHMWHPALGQGGHTVTADHELHMFHADTRCREQDHDHTAAPLPRDLTSQGICPGCRWHMIDRSEGTIVEAWHDHAMPGWRELPILPRKLAHFDSPKRIAAVAAWIAENYPTAWPRPGVPILTERDGLGTRHVPGRSPLGGYDISAD